jgi:hypothetical protein
MKTPVPNASTKADEPGEEAHRLHRDPADVDGLTPEKAGDHSASAQSTKRSEHGSKPYTAETESYQGAATKPPDDPAQRAEAAAPLNGRRTP